jgi:homoserine kinase
MGGLTVARMSNLSDNAAEAQVLAIRPKGKWPLLLAVPAQSLSTEAARRVLPAQYSRADAVANLQNSMLLLAAFTQGRPDVLSSALEDRFHQPYRAALCPLLPSLQELKGKDGVLGAVLSGAGPSVLIFLDPRTSLSKTRQRIAAHLRRGGPDVDLLPTSITLRGARSSFWKF